MTFTPMENSVLAGYFIGNNEYPKSQYPTSNEREMLHLNLQLFATPLNLKSVIAHEFQHMVNFNQKVMIHGLGPEETWLNEALSVYSEQVTGFGLPDGSYNLYVKMTNYLASPHSYPLNGWTGTLASYGRVYLFALYLAEQFGADAIRSLVTSNKTGIENIENTTGKSFSEIYTKWTAANYLDGLIAETEENAGYYYSYLNLRGTYNTLEYNKGEQTLSAASYEAISSFPYQGSTATVKAWAPIYLVFQPAANNNLRITLTREANSSIEAFTFFDHI